MKYWKIIDKIVEIQDMDDIEYNSVHINIDWFTIFIWQEIFSFELEHLSKYEYYLLENLLAYIKSNKIDIKYDPEVTISIVHDTKQIWIKCTFDFQNNYEIMKYIQNELF